MLAIDQREAMRNMFAEHQAEPVSDEQVTAFKLAAARILTPYASAVLVDRQFAFDRVVAESAVAPGCGLIAAADEFTCGSSSRVPWR
jgi:sulfofructosephosphate aldolase